MAARHGLEKLGFLTLTFADLVLDAKEAQRRFNSLNSNVLRERYPASVRVMERCKSGRIHYHLVVALGIDIRTGVDFEELAARKYTTAGPALRAEWAFWRRTAKLYGFGRTELLPIKSTDEGIARYVGKYIGKHMFHRRPEDKGVRLVGVTKAARSANTKFAWAGGRSAQWRQGVAVWAETLRWKHGLPASMEITPETIRALEGPKWAFMHGDLIFRLGELSG